MLVLQLRINSETGSIHNINIFLFMIIEYKFNIFDGFTKD